MTSISIEPGDKAIAFPFLEKAIKTGGHDWQQICANVDAYHCQIWLAMTDRPIAALVTQMTVDDVFECLLAGGTDARSWAGAAERHLAGFATANGSQRLRLWGRKGWERIFPHWENMGMEDNLVILERGI